MNDLFDALLTEDLTLLTELLEAGCDVNAQDEEGRTALIQAAIYNNVEVVQILIDHGANVNTRDFFSGNAALHFAAKNYSLELLQLLLKIKISKTSMGIHLYFRLFLMHPVKVELLNNCFYMEPTEI
jgi:ankyrin repeat protein